MNWSMVSLVMIDCGWVASSDAFTAAFARDTSTPGSRARPWPCGPAAAGGQAWPTPSSPVKIDPETADFGARVDERCQGGRPGDQIAPVKASLEATSRKSIITRGDHRPVHPDDR